MPTNTKSVSHKKRQVNTDLRLAARLERLAPSMRDGETTGPLERKATWLAGALGLEFSDVLDDMIWFLWGRPDLLGGTNTDAWLANRCVYHVRGQAYAQRARRPVEWVPLDEMDEEVGAPDYGEQDCLAVAALMDECPEAIRDLVGEILAASDEVCCASSGRANVSELCKQMGMGKRQVHAGLGRARSWARHGFDARVRMMREAA